MALPPGPPLHAAIQTALFLARPVEFLDGCRARYGNLFTIDTLLFGKEISIVDPDLVKRVFTGDPDTLRAGEANSFLEPLVGRRSVLLLDGREHLRERRLMMPPFHGERMTAYARTMREITEQVADTFPVGRPFSLHPYMQRITLEIILRTVFGVDEGAHLESLRDALTRLLDRQSSLFSALASAPPFRKGFYGLSPWDGFVRDRRLATGLIHAQIARHRARKEQDEANTPRTDVLTMLIEARDEEGKPMTDEELHDELMTLLVAGHETTASMLCWAFDLLLDAPHVKARLASDLRETHQNHPNDPEAAADVAYLDATVKETLRLRPVIPAVGRRLTVPMNLGGYDIPAGSLLVPNTSLTHRLPSLYENPEAFEPERFLDKKPDPYAFYPFGGGVRRCLGMAFALYEMKIVMATLLGRVDLTKRTPGPARVRIRAFTYAPDKGTEVVLQGR